MEFGNGEDFVDASAASLSIVGEDREVDGRRLPVLEDPCGS